MTHEARIWAATAASILLVAGGVLAYGQATGTFALFTADTQNPSAVFQGSWVTGPTAFNVPVASGNGEYFTWTVGNHGVAAQEVYFADQGATTNCTGASYSNSLYAGGTALGAAVATIDGAGSGTSSDVPAANQGDYICYQIRSTNNVWYTASNVGTAIQVGLVPKTIVFSGAGSGNIVTNDTIKITYNHNPTYSGTTPENIVVAIGSTLTVPGVGTFSGGSITRGGTCTNSTIAAAGAVLTVTFKGCPNSTPTKILVTAGGSPAFTGAGTVTSTIGPAGHAYSVAQCNTASVCKPSMSY